RRAEAVAGRRYDAGFVQKARGEVRRVESLRHRDPDIKRGFGLLAFEAGLVQAVDENVATLLKNFARRLDQLVALVQRLDRRFLYGLENAGVDIRFHLREAADDLRIADGHADAPAGHVEALRQRVELDADLAGAVQLEKAHRPVAVEAHLGV